MSAAEILGDSTPVAAFSLTPGPANEEPAMEQQRKHSAKELAEELRFIKRELGLLQHLCDTHEKRATRAEAHVDWLLSVVGDNLRTLVAAE